MVGVGAFSWEGRGWGLAGSVRDWRCEGQKVPQSPKPRKIQSNGKVAKK